MDRKFLIKHLLKDKNRNISILGFLDNHPVKKVYKEKETLLILGESDFLWAYISGDNHNDLEVLINKFDYKTNYFASIENQMVPVITKNKQIDWQLTACRYILPEDMDVTFSDDSVKPLNVADANYIYNHIDYQNFTSVDYIEERIKKGITAGIYDQNTLVGWGLTHDDGALGFLHVMPDYRRGGYGEKIIKTLINKKREQDNPVFLNVEPNNIKPVTLFKKVGMVFDREINWIKIK